MKILLPIEQCQRTFTHKSELIIICPGLFCIRTHQQLNYRTILEYETMRAAA
jgi:hypothetical protein